MNHHVILAIARKDLVDAIRNYYILFAIALPVAMWLLFSLVFGSSTDSKLQIAVYDQGHSQLVAHLHADPSVQRVISVDSSEALSETVRSQASGGLQLPANFDDAVAGDRSPQLVMLTNGRRSIGETAAFRQVVNAQLAKLANRPAIANVVESDVNPPAGGGTSGFNLQNFLVPLFVVMGLSMTGSYVVPALLVEEKEKNTLKSILVSPASYSEVIVGKALVGLFYALLVTGIMVALMKGPGGNNALLASVVLLGSVFFVEVGLAMGALFKNTTQVNTWAGMIMLVLMAPSWTVGVGLSGPVDTVMHWIPTYYLVELLSVARGAASSGEEWFGATILVVCILAVFGLIVWALRRGEA
jgi:ABC-2 type transport system permease protein